MMAEKRHLNPKKTVRNSAFIANITAATGKDRLVLMR
jgi:hypothetical protein